ncbi:hypothetical protein ABK040_016862 [Willaertia magna]
MFGTSLVCLSARYTKNQIKAIRLTREKAAKRAEIEKQLRKAYFPALLPKWHKKPAWKQLVAELKQQEASAAITTKISENA